MSEIHFGTDGWRGVIARDFTFSNVALCAQGVAEYVLADGISTNGLMVGYDTRFGSREFADEVAKVLAGNGIKVYLFDRPAPTPVVAYNIVKFGTGGGIIITASHNPMQWNGFKFRSSYGGSATAAVTDVLENTIHHLSKSDIKSISMAEAGKRNLVEYINPMDVYVPQLFDLVDIKAINESGLHVITDPMYGAGLGYFPHLINGGATKLCEVHGEPNPFFPNLVQPEPIKRNMTHLSTMVIKNKADVGLALDADGDRLGVIDERGEYLDSLQVFALLARYLLHVRGERGALVKTVTSTSMIFRLGELYKVPVFETSVGFKNICPIFLKEDVLMAGEESGGFAFRNHVPERDGVLSGLLFLELMVKTNKSASELLKDIYSLVGPHFYKRKDVKVPSHHKEEIKQLVETMRPKEIDGKKILKLDNVDGKRFQFEDGWVALRFSGTEPLIRIYGESSSPRSVSTTIEGLARMIEVT